MEPVSMAQIDAKDMNRETRFPGRASMAGPLLFCACFSMEHIGFARTTRPWTRILRGGRNPENHKLKLEKGVEYGHGTERRRKLKCHVPLLPGKAGGRSDLRFGAFA